MNFVRQQVQEFRDYFDALKTNFDYRFLILLASTYIGIKGFLLHCVFAGMLPYFKDLMHADGIKFQIATNVASLGFALKSAIGVISDTIPIRGYHKKYYIMGMCVVGCVALTVISLLPEGYATIASVLFLLAGLYAAAADLLVEGKYTEMMARVPQSGSTLVTFVWGCIQSGGFVAACLVGPLADSVNPRIIFLICLPFALQLLLPVAAGYLFEPDPSTRRNIKINVNRTILILCVSMTVCVLGFALMALFGTPLERLSYTLLSSVFLCLIMHYFYPRTLAKANLYMFLKEALYLQIPGALDYFYTADPECVPGGPAFSYTYYQTYTQILTYFAGAIGVMCFQKFLGTRTFHFAFCITIGIKVAASLFDIIMVKRWNVDIGIPDKAMYVFGDAIIQSLTQMMEFMPAVVLTSKLCPKGFEASVFALLASFQNYGQNVSRSIGGVLIEAFGIKTTAPCDFSNLPLLLLVGHVLIPLLSIPLAFVLIPSNKMTDTMAEYVQGFSSGKDSDGERDTEGDSDELSNFEQFETPTTVTSEQ
eukprot:PhF_6_TR38177/c0_g1_i1/m.57071